MKYMYMTCLVLSSFFIYNPLFADTNNCEHAFFIPGGAFQQNTKIQEIKQIQPQKQSTERTTTQQKNTIKQTPQPQKTKQTINSKQTNSAKVTPTAPAEKNITENTTTPQSSPKTNSTNTVKKNAPPKKQYILEDTLDNSPSEEKTSEKPQISSLEQFQQKTMQEILNTLPYPDFNLPKYKQIYALYALELRSAYRRGELPANYDQEEVLSKANSIRRFNVK